MPPSPRVLVTRPLPGRAIQMLREAGLDVEVRAEETPPGPAEIRGLLADKDGVLCVVGDRLDAETIDAAPRLRAIALGVVGTDDVDLAAAGARGISVTNTPGILTETTADFAFALLLAAARRVVEGDRMVREGRFLGWSPALLLGHDVHGKSIGIVGFGRIGQAVARRAIGFGMEVLHVSRTRKPGDVSLDDLLARSDFVVLCVPLTPETRHLVGEVALARMKPTAVLVNVARAGVVDDRALLDALRSKRIAAAALDVYESEPVPLPGLVELPNVVLAPHAASASIETRVAMAETAARNLIAALRR